MTSEKKSFIFIVVCCCLFTVPFFLAGPAAALDGGTAEITGNVILVVYDITVTGIGTNHATVSWKTNGEANSTVEYGTTTSYGSIITNGIMAKDHTIQLNYLLPGRVYHFHVISCNLAGTCAVSADLIFITTAPPPAPPGPGPNYWGDGGSDDWSIPTKTTQPVTLPQPTLTEPTIQPTLPEQTPQSNLTGLIPQPTPQNQEQYEQTSQSPAVIIPAMQSWWPANPLWMATILILILLALVIIALYLRQKQQKKT
jgi:hypothetical protein